MNKKWIFIVGPIFVIVAAFLVYTLRPSKQYAVHMGKARLFASKKNYTLAHEEYKAAYSHAGGFTPWVSLEVLKIEMDAAIKDKKPEKAQEYAINFVNAYPKNLDGKRILARNSLAMGDVDHFFSSVESILSEKPFDFQARYLLAQSYIQQNRLDLAEENLDRLYKQNPDSGKALLPLAQIVLARGDVKKSRTLLRKVIELHPTETAARLSLVDSYLRERNLDSAQIVFDEWSNKDESLKEALAIRKAALYSMLNHLAQAESTLAPYTNTRSANIDALGELALIKAKSGKYDSAYAIYKSIAEAKPNQQAMPLLLTSLLMMANEQPAQALELLKHLKIGEKSSNLLYYVIACYRSMDMANKSDSLVLELPEDLRGELKEFQNNFPIDKKFLSNWAKVNYYQQTNQVAWSRLAVDSLYKQWPKNSIAMLLMSEKLTATREFKAAVTILEKLPSPTLAQRINLMKTYSNAGSIDKALALAKEIRDHNPKMKGINFILGDLLMNKNQHQDAAMAFENEIALDPENLICINNLAWYYGVKMNDFAKANPYIRMLKEKNKTADPRYFDTIGWVLGKQNELDEAKLFLERANNLQPGNSEVQYHLAAVEIKKGDTEKGKSLLKESLASNNHFDEYTEAESLNNTFSNQTQKP